MLKKEIEICRKKENKKRGIIYYREGICGDYDDFDDVKKLIEFIKIRKR